MIRTCCAGQVHVEWLLAPCSWLRLPLYLVMGTPPSLGNEVLFAAYVTRSHTIAITTKLVDVVYLLFRLRYRTRRLGKAEVFQCSPSQPDTSVLAHEVEPAVAPSCI